MIRNYLFARLFGILAYYVSSSVGHEAIIGGHRAKASGEFKYQVSLQNNGRHFCGGAIIGAKFVLTAASCVLGNRSHIKYPSITVLAGTIDLARTSEPAVTGQVEKFFTPTEFLPALMNSEGDIAVLQLYEAFILRNSRTLRIVLLPMHKGENYDNSKVIIAGFGITWVSIAHGIIVGDGINNTRLQWAEADVLALSEPACNWIPLQSHSHLCARLEQNKYQTRGICLGDGGSPLVLHETVIGVLSKGPVGCSERFIAAIYTRISEFRTFIRNVKANKIYMNISKYVLANRQLAAGPSQETAT